MDLVDWQAEGRPNTCRCLANSAAPTPRATVGTATHGDPPCTATHHELHGVVVLARLFDYFSLNQLYGCALRSENQGLTDTKPSSATCLFRSCSWLRKAT